MFPRSRSRASVPSKSLATQSNGQRKFQFTPGNKDIGTQTATFTFSGDAGYESKTVTVNFKVVKVVTTIITTFNPNPAKPGTKVAIRPRLVHKNSTSKGIGSKSVTVSYSSASYSRTTSTNSSGYGYTEFTPSTSTTGKLYIQVSFKGDNYYASTSQVPVLTVPANETKMTATTDKSTVAPLNPIVLKGKLQWKKRLGGSFSASPVHCDGRIYVCNTSGTTFVFKATADTYEQIAKNQLGDQALATPAICGRQIFMRVVSRKTGKRQEMLYCVGGGANP